MLLPWHLDVVRLPGAVTRFTTFYSADALAYLELLGGQTWRLARAYDSVAPENAHIGEEAERLLCAVDFLTANVGEPLRLLTHMTGFGLPHLQLLALHAATDLRHFASIAGANLASNKVRKGARGSKAFAAVFRLLSCRVEDNAEALHKVFRPFASLAIRIGGPTQLPRN